MAYTAVSSCRPACGRLATCRLCFLGPSLGFSNMFRAYGNRLDFVNMASQLQWQQSHQQAEMQLGDVVCHIRVGCG